MASTSSSSASPPTHLFKHDVFLSFRGEDTRHSFISHLHTALCRKSIRTFIDNELRRGEEISRALLNAIEESMFAVVVFSEGYAFSRWCLDELAKIVECVDTRGQKVIPVFYHVDPSDVRKQTGTFADAFARHEGNFKSNLEQVQRWRAALTKAANLSGWATQDCRLESAIVDGIVDHIRKDLQKMWSSPSENLVGIGPRIEELQKLLCVGSSTVFILGLWGMGGIGKTTIASFLFDRIQSQFERYFFLENIREESEKRGLQNLGERLLSRVLEEGNVRISMPDVRKFFYMLRDIKVLLVLDDVDNMKQLEYLVGDRRWCGPGSRIIITSRDKQLLKNVADAIYQVKELADLDAVQLFCLHAFKDVVPTDDLRGLSVVVAGYAKGVPLALKVLGSSLYDKGKREWESTLKKLENAPHKEIQDVLRISYTGLDREQKEIFLWIACLLNHLKKDYVTQFLDSCGLSTEIGLTVLVDKSLTTISDYIRMHDLLEEMGREIVREESEDLGERKWLWDREDIYQVFRKNSGTKKIKGIQLETYQMKEVQLHPDTFARMPNLKYLQIQESSSEYKVQLPRGISGLPDELRILYWEDYPLESLPANFNPENLIELSLRRSNVIEVFCEESPDLGKLRNIDLSWSQKLCKIPNLARAPDVTELNLHGCSSLCEVSSSICHLSNVTSIDFAGCEKLRSIPDLSDLKSLRRLELLGCSNLETFPKVPQSIEYLDLSETAIKEVPSASLECLSNLAELLMRHCTQLGGLPSNIDLKSLNKLDLSDCSALKKFPEISNNLQELYLDKTATTQVPSSVVCLSQLWFCSMRGCTELGMLPITILKLQSLKELHLDGCSSLTEFSQSLEEEQQEEKLLLGHLEILHLSDCNLVKLPNDLGRLCSTLTVLVLRRNSFKTIPESIKQLSQLGTLDIADCKSLQSLPELPPNLHKIIASGCSSLETISAALTSLFFDSKNLGRIYNFTDCLKLNQKECGDLAHAAIRNQHLTNFLTIAHWDKEKYKATSSVFMVYTGSMIPGWFKHQSVGDSISIQLPSNWLNHGFLGFALGVVYEPCGIAGGYHSFHYELHIGDKQFSRVLGSFPDSNFINYGTETEHILLKFDHVLPDEILRNPCVSQSCHDVALFKFDKILNCQGCCKIKMCGVIPLYAQEEGHNTMPLLPLGGPAEAALDCSLQRAADELGRNGGTSEMDEEPPRPRRLKQTQADQDQH